MQLKDATEEDILVMAKDLAERQNRIWDDLTDEEQSFYRVEAVFSFNWFSE